MSGRSGGDEGEGERERRREQNKPLQRRGREGEKEEEKFQSQFSSFLPLSSLSPSPFLATVKNSYLSEAGKERGERGAGPFPLLCTVRYLQRKWEQEEEENGGERRKGPLLFLV